MSYETRRTEALTLPASTGIGRGNDQPPASRLLWKCGVNGRTPYCVPFWKTTLSASAWFGVAGGWPTAWIRMRDALSVF